jgi:GIY-YIG catalytic domain
MDYSLSTTTTNVYVLLLEDGNYYVGKSRNVEERFKQHQAGSGSAWTRRYKPVAIVETLPNVSPLMEDLKTKEYMSLYGIQKVRGASYCQMLLPPPLIQSIQREIWSAQDRCMKCGSNQHWVTECTQREQASCCNAISGWIRRLFAVPVSASVSSAPTITCRYCKTRKFTSSYGCALHEKACKNSKLLCSRCGFTGHEVNGCFAKRTVSGAVL